jgi:hypothetical protein
MPPKAACLPATPGSAPSPFASLARPDGSGGIDELQMARFRQRANPELTAGIGANSGALHRAGSVKSGPVWLNGIGRLSPGFEERQGFFRIINASHESLESRNTSATDMPAVKPVDVADGGSQEAVVNPVTIRFSFRRLSRNTWPRRCGRSDRSHRP